MPAARALRAERGCRIVLESHDVQARQFVLRNEKAWRLRPKATFEEMLGLEMAQMAEADLLIHLNDEEAKTWAAYLPDKRHALLYPAVKSVAANRGGRDLIIVASDNYPNFLSVAWFLEEVRPRARDVAIKIIGNIDQAFKTRAPELFRQHGALFLGRVEDLDAFYADAAAILLPTTSGHGISIKTIEALSSGAPLIATPEAFRGMAIDPSQLANVTLVSDAAAFAAAVRSAATRKTGSDARQSDTRRLYERTFSPEAYRQSLADCVAPYFPTAGSI
jgi:polysaccharide biosynthesis protein PslH